MPGWLLNTTDKGYSVVITMPKKMSLVRIVFDRMVFVDVQRGFFRRKRRSYGRLVHRLSARLMKSLGIHPGAI